MISCVSADKTSVVSADKTSICYVCRQDICCVSIRLQHCQMCHCEWTCSGEPEFRVALAGCRALDREGPCQHRWAVAGTSCCRMGCSSARRQCRLPLQSLAAHRECWRERVAEVAHDAGVRGTLEVPRQLSLRRLNSMLVDDRAVLDRQRVSIGTLGHVIMRGIADSPSVQQGSVSRYTGY